MAAVPWNLHVIVLNDILFDDGLSGGLSKRLLYGSVIHISLGKEPIVAWNMRSHLSSPDTIYS